MKKKNISLLLVTLLVIQMSNMNTMFRSKLLHLPYLVSV